MIDVKAFRALLVEAVRHPDLSAALADAIAPRVAELVRHALDARAETLQPLADILNIKRKAAAARIRNDAGLRALGVPSGQRLVFRASDVEAYLRSRRGPAIRLVNPKEVRRG